MELVGVPNGVHLDSVARIAGILFNQISLLVDVLVEVLGVIMVLDRRRLHVPRRGTNGVLIGW